MKTKIICVPDGESIEYSFPGCDNNSEDKLEITEPDVWGKDPLEIRYWLLSELAYFLLDIRTSLTKIIFMINKVHSYLGYLAHRLILIR